MTIKQQGGVFGRNPTFNDLTAETVDINGGTIDGVVIGGSVPASINGTTGDFTGNLDVTGKGFFRGSGSFEALELITSDANRVYVTGNSSTSGDMWRIGTSTSNQNLNIDALRPTGNILLRTGGTNERMRVDTTGNLDMTAGGGNVILASGAGIDFSATSGTGTSELFDDYEEGTFTASIGGFISNPTTPVTTTSYYTKVGRKVSVSIAFNNVTTTGAAGAVLISGLPFTSTSEALSAIQISGTGSAPAVAHLGSGGTVIDLLDAVSYTNISHSAGAGKYFVLSMTYFA